MRSSVTRFLSGIMVVGSLAFGVVAAVAASAPDAGIGYSSDYGRSANGSGVARRHCRYNDGLRHGAAELASDFNFSPTRGEIASVFVSVSRMDSATCSARSTSAGAARCKFSAIDGE